MPKAAQAPRYPINAFLIDAVGIEHSLPADLVQAAVEMPAELRQHRHLQELVFEEERAVAFDFPLIGQRVANGVGIVEALGGKQIERRILARQLLHGRRQRELALPCAHRRHASGLAGLRRR